MKVYEFDSHDDFSLAARTLYQTQNLLELYSFLPEEKIFKDLNYRLFSVPTAAITGALIGALGGFLLQYFPNVFGFSFNIGGKPLNSWPAFLIITFELSVLTCAVFIVLSFIFSNKFPRFDRPILKLDAYNKNRHKHYFIVSIKEDPHVKALAIHDIDDLP
ncbi:MAG: quinol:electron acceptor oxidoreductase subunit ActD [Bacteriovoracaceae bacterium]